MFQTTNQIRYGPMAVMTLRGITSHDQNSFETKNWILKHYTKKVLILDFAGSLDLRRSTLQQLRLLALPVVLPFCATSVRAEATFAKSRWTKPSSHREPQRTHGETDRQLPPTKPPVFETSCQRHSDHWEYDTITTI